ncbi:MAG TPA: hypothetical protein IAA29_00760 [Candidatus Paenibacillus intestinavium]|nr:hypothetical protein [Candidatus Paenibacillus intestinavium]
MDTKKKNEKVGDQEQVGQAKNDTTTTDNVEGVAELITIVWTKNVRHNGERCKVGERAQVTVNESEKLVGMKVARLLEV